MDLSPIGEAVLIAREGRRLKAYRDSVGVLTIGIGCTRIDGRPVRSTDSITSAQCDALFEATVAQYVAAVNRDLKVPVTQNVFDALVSLAYNIGIAGFSGSTFLRRINAGDMAGAREAILMWQKPTAIISRRQAEAEQFVTSLHAGPAAPDDEAWIGAGRGRHARDRAGAAQADRDRDAELARPHRPLDRRPVRRRFNRHGQRQRRADGAPLGLTSIRKFSDRISA